MLSALNVAKFFINLFKDQEEGITNLKLQKLLYYAQGFSFQRFNKPLFPDEIEAWEYGPVIHRVYDFYKSYGLEPIRNSEQVRVNEDQERLLLDVAREYGKYTSTALVDMTHAKGTPWSKVYIEGEMHKIISKEQIKQHFIEHEEQLASFNIEDLLSKKEYKTVDKNTIIPLSEWDYEEI